MYYLLLYEVVEDYAARRAPLRAEHLALAAEAHARGELVIAGALAAPIDGAVLVFRADSPEPVRAFVENDPYVRSGLVTSWRIREWTVVIGGEEAATAGPDASRGGFQGCAANSRDTRQP